MGRAIRTNVDYFPCNCKDGKTLFILESRWGNNGFCLFYRLWKRLGDADFHFIDLRKVDNYEYFIAQMKISEPEILEMLDKLAVLGVIDPELWAERILWSDSFVEDIKDVWIKRNKMIPQKPLFLIQKTGNPDQKSPESSESGPESAQIKEKKIKENTNTSEPDGPETTGDNPPGPPEKKQATTYSVESVEYKLADFLHKKILAHYPTLKPCNLNHWAKQVDLMIRIDGRDPQEIVKVIKFAQADQFWKTNILSTSSLREKYDTLKMKMGGTNGKGSITRGTQAGSGATPGQTTEHNGVPTDHVF